MEVVVISREIVKPAIPTPPHLRRLPLSFLDQLSDPHFMPLIFYYTASSDTCGFHLKAALSLTLARFYPLAGRIQDNDSVNCNDEGISYRQARVTTHRLLDVVRNAQPSDVQCLIPPKPPTSEHIMSIQVNFFPCGGVAIATHSSHKTLDALSVITFANAWAAAARKDLGSIVTPKFDMTPLFPPRETSCYSRCTSDLETNVVSKRFILSGSALSLLRDKYTTRETNGYRRPSLVEALSTFVWTRFVRIKRNNNKGNRKYALIQAVNLRTRIKPHLPASYVGNLSRFAVVVDDVDTGGGASAKDGFRMVSRMRESIRKIDAEYLEKLKNGDLQVEWLEEVKKEGGECLSFSALHKLPLPEVDFGGGSPTWVTLGGLHLRNTVYFLPTSRSSAEEMGVEAWINLKEEDMLELEQDPEFQKFASPVSGLP